MGGKEALSLPRRLEPLHDPLSSSGRLMGVFGPVIEALVAPMLDPGHDLPLGRGVALQLVGDKHTRCATVLLEELAEQTFGGLLVAPALDQNIENEPILVDGTPEPMLPPGDADDDLIEVPFVATARRSLTNAVGEFPAEFKAPIAESSRASQRCRARPASPRPCAGSTHAGFFAHETAALATTVSDPPCREGRACRLWKAMDRDPESGDRDHPQPASNAISCGYRRRKCGFLTVKRF